MNNLTLNQLQHYTDFRSTNGVPLTIVDMGEPLQAFLSGSTLDEVAQSFPEFSLGQIVDAYVRYDWEQARANNIERVALSSAYKYAIASSEVVGHLSNYLMAVHKKIGQDLRRYLDTGDESFIQGIDLKSFRTYKEAVETLQNVTGVDPKQKQSKPKAKEASINTTKSEKVLDAEAILALQGDSDGEK